MKLAIVVGHEATKRGAQMAEPFSYLNEYDFNKVLAAQIFTCCLRKNIECEVFFRDGLGIVKTYQNVKKFNPGCIIELHFNSFSKESVKGTETFYGDIAGSDKLARLVHDHIIAVLVRPKSEDRGVKKLEKFQNGGTSVNNSTGIPTILIEPFFGSNVEDCLVAIEQMNLMADHIADAVLFWGMKDGKIAEVH